MSVQNRKAVREEFGALLSAVLTPYVVYVDQPSDFEGQSPVVVLASTGSEREGATRRTFGGPIAPLFRITAYVFVLPGSGADDQLDDIERSIAQLIADQVSGASWSAIGYSERTTAEFISILDGTEYKREIIPLAFTGR